MLYEPVLTTSGRSYRGGDIQVTLCPVKVRVVLIGANVVEMLLCPWVPNGCQTNENVESFRFPLCRHTVKLLCGFHSYPFAPKSRMNTSANKLSKTRFDRHAPKADFVPPFSSNQAPAPTTCFSVLRLVAVSVPD